MTGKHKQKLNCPQKAKGNNVAGGSAVIFFRQTVARDHADRRRAVQDFCLNLLLGCLGTADGAWRNQISWRSQNRVHSSHGEFSQTATKFLWRYVPAT